MKMLSLVSLMVLLVCLFQLALPVRAEDAAAAQGQAGSQDVKLNPEMQAVLAQLLKMVSGEHAPAPAAPQAAPTAPAVPANASVQDFLKTLNAQMAQANQGGQGGQGGQSGNVDVNQLLPFVIKMLKTLDSELSGDEAQSAGTTSTAPSTAAPAATAPAPASRPRPTALQSSSLRSSTGLVTHSLSNTPRMSNDEWRQLFPAQAGK